MHVSSSGLAGPPWRALSQVSFSRSCLFCPFEGGPSFQPFQVGRPALAVLVVFWFGGAAKFRSLDHVCFVLSRAGHPSSLSRLAGPPWRALVILQSERILCGVRASRRSSCVNLVSGGRPPSLPHGLCLSSSAGPPWRTFLKLCFLDVYLFILFRFGGPALAGFLL